MVNNKVLLLMLTSLMSIGISGCGNKDISDSSASSSSNSESEEVSESTSSTKSDTSSYTFSQEEDYTKLIPEDVLNADCDIDYLIYIEGQDGSIDDIGNYYCGDKKSQEYKDMIAANPNEARKYDKFSVSSPEMAEFFATAAAFKQIAPNVRINLKYCSIADYPSRVEAYQKTNKHLPELMWGTEHVVQMLQKGYCADVSKYSDSEYYQQYNDYFLSRFNFGGFQAALPLSSEPWGIFVNLDILSDPKYGIISEAYDENNLPSQEYKDWVDNFTIDTFVDAVKKTYDPENGHAGLSQVSEYYASYGLASINKQYIEQGSIDLTSTDVITKVEKMLKIENELTQYCAYGYSDTQSNSLLGNRAKEEFEGLVYPWFSTKNFVETHYATFFSESPWALPLIHEYIVNGEAESTRSTHVDFLPYPAFDEDSDSYTGIAIEGTVVGNQCPIENGKENCSANGKLKEDVAAYFAMFAGLDPRALKSRCEVEYVFNDQPMKGDLSLPLSKKNMKFSWQTDPDSDIEDPAADYTDNFTYELAMWFKLYSTYVTDGKEADLDNFTNISYGLLKMFDSIYMFDGIGDDYVTCLNFTNEPYDIEEDGEVVSLFKKWMNRFTYYGSAIEGSETGEMSGRINNSDYVSIILDNLADIENEINTKAEKAWNYVASQIGDYYYDEDGNSLYPNASDRSYRLNYEGSQYN